MVASAITAAVARRERGRGEMRRAILDAARAIVAEQGLDALSMRAIARAIGYSPAALYEYFPAKERVLAALYFAGTGGLNGRMREAMASRPPNAPTEEVLASLGRAYRGYAHEQPELYRLVFAGAMADEPPKEEQDHEPGEGFGLLVEVARRGVERGDFLPLPPPVIAGAAWAAVHGFVSLELSGHLRGGSPPVPRPSPSSEAGHAPQGAPAQDALAQDALFEATVQMCLYGFVRR